MFIPIGDEPNPRTRPVVVYALIAVNVLVFLFVSLPGQHLAADPTDPAYREYLRMLAAEQPGYHLGYPYHQISAFDLLNFKYGFRPAAPNLFDLFASMFLHGGWLHLLGNMLFLYIYGDNVEAKLGRARFLLTYLATGAAGTLFFSVFQLGSSTPLVGASGAISGVLGAYFWWFPNNQVRVLVFFFFITIWKLPARFVLGAYLVLSNVLPFLLEREPGSVAYGAHIGGFVAGLAAAVVLSRGRRRPREEDARAGAWVLDRRGQPIVRVEPAPSFRTALREGDFGQAAELYARMSGSERLAESDADVLALAQGLADASRVEAALAVLQSFISSRPASVALAEAHYLAGVLHLKGTGRLLAARQHLLTVLDCDPMPKVERAGRQALALVEDALRRRTEV